MNAIALFTALCATVSVGCGIQDKGVVGKWVAQVFIEYESSPEGGSSFSLEFKDDGSFTGRSQTHVMMVRDSKITGKYTRIENTLSLAGTADTYMDDGYGKSNFTEPFEMQLRVEADRLTRLPYDPTFVIAFRREGTPPLKPPKKPAEKPSQLAALDLIRKVEQRYSRMKTYSDDGSFKSSGQGFQPKECRFRIRFSDDGRFLFKADSIRDGKVYETNAAWTTASKSWVYLGMDGAKGERPIGNALSIVGMDFSTLIPSLLMPKKMGGSDLSDRKSVVLLPEDRVSGRACKVVEFDSGTKHATRIWVDSQSLLIRKAHGKLIDTTATFNPKPDVSISAGEFLFKPPKN